MDAFLIASIIAFWVLFVALAVLVLGLARQVGMLQQQVDAGGARAAPPPSLSPGSDAPDFTATATTGERITLASFAGRDLLLVFARPSCGACAAIVPDLNELVREAGGRYDVLMLMEGAPEAVREWAARHDLRCLTAMVEPPETFERYMVRGTPSAVALRGGTEVLDSGPAGSASQLRQIAALLAQTPDGEAGMEARVAASRQGGTLR